MLHVRYESWRKNELCILDADNNTTLYTIKLQMRKPQMTIESISTKATTGTVIFHTLTNRIETTVHNSPITLTSRGLLKNGHKWSSSRSGNVDMTWITNRGNFNLVCLDEQALPVARFIFPNWSLRKAGTFEILAPEMSQGAVMDEIIVTGLAMAEYNIGLANVNALV
jgi:hypothetical protein